MTVKITAANGGSDSLDFGCAQTAIVATVTGTEVSSGEGKLELKTTTGGTSAAKLTIAANGTVTLAAPLPVASGGTGNVGNNHVAWVHSQTGVGSTNSRIPIWGSTQEDTGDAITFANDGTAGLQGDGGAGTSNSYSGSAVTYAGGGSGGNYGSGNDSVGGAGGGGTGHTGTPYGNGGAGTTNTGGGGGGSSGTDGDGNGTGGAGGSGIVIIRYLTEQ